MFLNKLRRRLSRNNIIRLIFTKNIVCRKQGREGQHHKYAVLLFFNLRSCAFFFFFFRRKRKSRRTGKEDKKNAPSSIRLPNKREGGPPDSRLCFLSKTVCLPCLVRREWAFITRRSYGTKRTKIYIPCWMANDPVGPWKKKDSFLNDVISVFLLPLGVVCPTARCVLYHATVSCKGSILYQPLPIHPMRNLVNIK